jgi:pyruvate dehydrogenase E1 component
MTSTDQNATGAPEVRLRTLRAIEDRVLWLSTAIVDQANRVRPNPSGLKVGGHQAST